MYVDADAFFSFSLGISSFASGFSGLILELFL